MAQNKTAKKTGTTKKKTTSSAPKKSSTSQKKSSAQKKSSTSSNKKKTKEELAIERQKWAMGLFAGAILMFCITIIEGESLWKILHMGMFAFFGTSAYALPVIILYVAIMMSMDRPLGSVTSNLVGVGVFILLLASCIHIFINDASYLSHESVLSQIKTAWNTYDEFPNSGLFGAVIGAFLVKIAGKVGAAIINVLLLVVLTMFLTGLTLARIGRLIKLSVKTVGKSTNDIFTRSIERNMERQAKRQAERAAETETAEENPSQEPTKEIEQQNVSKRHSRFPWEIPMPGNKSAAIEKDENPEGIVETSDGVLVDQNGEVVSDTQNKILGQVELDISDDDENKNIGYTSNSRPNTSKEIKSTILKDNTEVLKTNEGKPYHLPPLNCLAVPVKDNNDDCSEELKFNGKILLETLESFNVKAKIINICRGPSVTRYELIPDSGVRISKITNLSDDIALHLAARGIRIEAPIPGKAAIGIEVPNRKRSMVYMRELLSSNVFRDEESKIVVALGKDIAGNIICADLAKMPHLLIAGTTGSGKSVCINTMITSILYNATPDEVKILLIDPKQVEFIVYNGIAHLAVPVVTDARKASGALSWAVTEMEKRYKLFSEKGVRDIKGYNKYVVKYNASKAEDEPEIKKMHQIVIFIDELSDLMMVAPNEVESSICRLAQMARAAGMHLVIATQRPSVNVITGVIKANIPSRIALSVSSGVDSRTIIDRFGAEKLLGNGDMLYFPTGASEPLRVQGCYVSDEEVESLVDFIKNEADSTYDEEIMTEIEKQAAKAGNDEKSSLGSDDASDYEDEMFPNAVEVILNSKVASTTLLQKKLRIGYARASRIMDELEESGIVGPYEGSKPREVLITKQQWMERCALTGSNPKEE